MRSLIQLQCAAHTAVVVFHLWFTESRQAKKEQKKERRTGDKVAVTNCDGKYRIKQRPWQKKKKEKELHGRRRWHFPVLG